MSRENNWFKYFNKIPNLKFKKITLENIENIDELKSDYSKEAEKNEKKPKLKKGEHYQETNYKTIKEIYLHSMDKYSNEVFMLDKNYPKDERFIEYTYRQFGNDVEALGTALTNKYNLKNERIVIIGENQYDWYVSYMATLLGVGIAVPVDKELPVNEIENVVNRAKASCVIYSSHIKDRIKSIMDNLPFVKYFVQMIL